MRVLEMKMFRCEEIDVLRIAGAHAGERERERERELLKVNSTEKFHIDRSIRQTRVVLCIWYSVDLGRRWKHARLPSECIRN